MLVGATRDAQRKRATCDMVNRIWPGGLSEAVPGTGREHLAAQLYSSAASYIFCLISLMHIGT
jgi:hypothetical protein